MINDEILMAYADGGLDVAQKAEVERAAAADPLIAKRLRDHVSLRSRKAQAFPDGRGARGPLRDGLAPDGGTATVIDLAAARAARALPSKRVFPVGGAMAACLAIGLLVGAGLEALRPPPLISGRGGAMVAGNVLARALSHQVWVAGGAAQPIKIGPSYRTETSGYCRTFRVDQEAALVGVACRDPAAWSIRMALSGGKPASGGVGFTASDLPLSTVQLLQSLGAGRVLTPPEEIGARSNGWLIR